MDLPIDKFGRVLIPMKIRKLLGLIPNGVLKATVDPDTKSIHLVPKHNLEPVLSTTESGIPVFHYGPSKDIDFDVVELIRQDRKARDTKILGL